MDWSHIRLNKMKAILYKDVPSLGEENSLVEVSEGYARNYLFPKKLAGPATPSAVAALEKRKAEREKVLAQKKAELEGLAEKLSALEVSIAVDAGEGGKLFGSVTSQDIAEAIFNSKPVGIDMGNHIVRKINGQISHILDATAQVISPGGHHTFRIFN